MRQSRERVTELLEHQLNLVRNDKYADKLPHEYGIGDPVWVRDTLTVTGQGSIRKKRKPNYLPIPYRIVGRVDQGGGNAPHMHTAQPRNVGTRSVRETARPKINTRAAPRTFRFTIPPFFAL